MIRPGLEPTVRFDICESAAVTNFAIKAIYAMRKLNAAAFRYSDAFSHPLNQNLAIGRGFSVICRLRASYDYFMKVNVDREESSASPSTPALWEFVWMCQHTNTRGASSHILSTHVRDASSHILSTDDFVKSA